MTTTGEHRRRAVLLAVLGFPAIRVASCPACRAPLTGRKTVCSGKGRATLSRRRQEQRRQDRDARIAALLREALQLVERAYLVERRSAGWQDA
jgi:predicted nucleic acid-binding Zn ribbon protein